ncbi:MAG: hypothetical protein HKL92_03405 [Candidatus Eremiobacteraeota bacterium]|nr:hypothetical protein [Candidatus Eremiobacteraeota bacterium]NNM98612.1 hypothetical protein [Candidatus Eremiobacteraeota bacterium]
MPNHQQNRFVVQMHQASHLHPRPNEHDEAADATFDPANFPESVKTGRRIDEL